MYFKCIFVARTLALFFRERSAPTIEFKSSGRHPVTVTLRQKHRDAGPGTARASSPDWFDFDCQASVEQEPSSSIRGMLDDLAQRRVPAGSALASLVHWEWLTGDGLLHPDGRVDVRYMPAPLRDFCQQVLNRLTEFAARTVGLIRWRFASPQGHRQLVGPSDFVFSADGVSWVKMPYDHLALSWLMEDYGDRPLFDEQAREEITTLLAEEHQEPLGHVLFREAWEQRGTAPRSSLLLGIAAAEVGFKQHVARMLPEAAWLVENVPSPPLERMLADYFPTLPSRHAGIKKEIPRHVVTSSKKGFSSETRWRMRIPR
jgi:hypothetical protein